MRGVGVWVGGWCGCVDARVVSRMKVLGLDPGPLESAYAVYDTETGRPGAHGKRPNEQLRYELTYLDADVLAVEMIASYGMPVGAEVFETCVWAGRFIEAWAMFNEWMRVYRKDVKMHLCGSTLAKDSNIRQALIDRWGGKAAAIGVKASPGPLYGFKADTWAALAVAVTAAETRL